MSLARDQKLVLMNENDEMLYSMESFAVVQLPIHVVDENVMDKFWQETVELVSNKQLGVEMLHVPVLQVVVVLLDVGYVLK